MKKFMKLGSFLYNNRFILLSGIFGAVAFFFLYGIEVLSFTYDNYIIVHSGNFDPLENYMGWNAYRNDIWRFPLTMTKNICFPDGNLIAYTDSVPILAMFFKLINFILPTKFQYFGLLIFIDFILMGIFSYKIILMLTNEKIYSLISSVFFIFSPIFLYKTVSPGIQTHWLILISIYEYVLFVKNKKFDLFLCARFLLYECLAMGIHPYFLPHIVIFYFLIVVKSKIGNKKILYFFIVQILTIIFGVIIGTLGTKYGRTGDISYGIFSMNLNSFINSESEFENAPFSLILKKLPRFNAQYESFCYLGLGMIIFIVLVLLLLLNKKIRIYLFSKLKEHFLLILIFCCCFLFGLSHRVTINKTVLFEIPLPENIIYFCGIFRSSGRMFWSAYYFIFVIVIFIAYKIPFILKKGMEGRAKKYVPLIVISIILFIQIFDMKDYLIYRSNFIKGRDDEFVRIYECYAKEFEKICGKNEIITIDYKDDVFISRDVSDVVNLALTKGFKLCNVLSNSGAKYKQCDIMHDKICKDAKEKGILKRTIICTDDYNVAKDYFIFDTLQCDKIENVYFIYSKNE